MRKVEKNKGAALLFVLVIMAIFTVLTLSLILVSSVLMNQSQKKVAREQSKVLAVSLSKVLQQDLEGKKEGSIYTYAQKVGKDSKWPYYDNDENGHTKARSWKYFTMSSGSPDEETKGVLEDSEVALYWQPSEEDTQSALLYVRVTCTYGGESFTITTSYLENEEGGWGFNERE